MPKRNGTRRSLEPLTHRLKPLSLLSHARIARDIRIEQMTHGACERHVRAFEDRRSDLLDLACKSTFASHSGLEGDVHTHAPLNGARGLDHGLELRERAHGEVNARTDRVGKHVLRGHRLVKPRENRHVEIGMREVKSGHGVGDTEPRCTASDRRAGRIHHAMPVAVGLYHRHESDVVRDCRTKLRGVVGDCLERNLSAVRAHERIDFGCQVHAWGSSSPRARPRKSPASRTTMAVARLPSCERDRCAKRKDCAFAVASAAPRSTR